MPIIKCKMCNAVIVFSDGQKTAECNCCGEIHNICSGEKSENKNQALICKICGLQINCDSADSHIVCSECGTEYDVQALKEDNKNSNSEKLEFRKANLDKHLTDADKEILDNCSGFLREILVKILVDKKSHEIKANYAPLSLGPEKNMSDKFAKLERMYKDADKYKQFITDELIKRNYQNVYVSFTYNTESFSTRNDIDSFKRDCDYYHKVKMDSDYDLNYRNSLSEPIMRQSGCTHIYNLTVKVEEEGLESIKLDKEKEERERQAPLNINTFDKSEKKTLTYTQKRKLKKLIKSVIIAALLIVAFIAIKNVVINAMQNSFDSSKTTASQNNAEINYYYVMADDCNAINIRKNASKEAKVLTVVNSQNIKLVPTGIEDGDWIQVKVDFVTGWVFRDVVEKVEE